MPSTMTPRHQSARVLAAAAFLCCVTISLGLLALVGDELDADAVLPFQDSSHNDDEIVTPAPPPGVDRSSDDGPSGEALLVLALLVGASAVPLVMPRRLFRAGLIAGIAIVGLFVVVSLLRLGLLFVPVLGLEIAALRSDSRTPA